MRGGARIRGSMRPGATVHFLSALLWAGCASAPESGQDGESRGGASPDAPATLEEARAEIGRAIGDARAESASQCRLVAIGDRPCGGPRQYLAYSLVVTDSVELATLAELHARLDRERNAELGLVSTCELLMPPGVGLEGERCVTR